MIVAFVLVFAVNVVSLVALNQNLKTVSDQLTDYATLNGTVAVDSYAAELKKQTGIEFGYSFDGSQLYDANGKVPCRHTHFSVLALCWRQTKCLALPSSSAWTQA